MQNSDKIKATAMLAQFTRCQTTPFTECILRCVFQLWIDTNCTMCQPDFTLNQTNTLEAHNSETMF